jgi:hypothetical protein
VLRAPSAAVWRVTADWRWQALHGLLLAWATAAVVVWLVQQTLVRWPELALPTGAGAGESQVDASWLALASGLVLGAVAAVWGWRLGSQPEGRILWTGSQWRWQADAPGAQAHDVTVVAMLDGGGWLLLRLHPPRQARAERGFWRHRRMAGQPRWLCVRGPQGQTTGERTQWVAFRAAVYSAASRCDGLALPNSLLH